MTIEFPEPQTMAVSGLTEVVAANAQEIRETVRGKLKEHPDVTRLDFDLSNATFVDSSGLGMFISLQKTLRERSGTVRLLHPAPNVLQILELTRLHRVFEIVP